MSNLQDVPNLYVPNDTHFKQEAFYDYEYKFLESKNMVVEFCIK